MASPETPFLTEELTTLHAIYGPDFLITSQTATSTAISITLSSQPFSFLLSIPSAYPQRPPQIQGTDPLWLRDATIAKAGTEAFKTWFHESFVPGHICLFDVFQDVRDVLSREGTVRQEPIAPTLPLPPDQEARPMFLDVEAMQGSGHCIACLDTLLWVDMATLVCKHSYCTDCLQHKPSRPRIPPPYLPPTRMLANDHPKAVSSSPPKPTSPSTAASDASPWQQSPRS